MCECEKPTDDAYFVFPKWVEIVNLNLKHASSVSRTELHKSSAFRTTVAFFFCRLRPSAASDRHQNKMTSTASPKTTKEELQRRLLELQQRMVELDDTTAGEEEVGAEDNHVANNPFNQEELLSEDDAGARGGEGPADDAAVIDAVNLMAGAAVIGEVPPVGRGAFGGGGKGAALGNNVVRPGPYNMQKGMGKGKGKGEPRVVNGPPMPRMPAPRFPMKERQIPLAPAEERRRRGAPWKDPCCDWDVVTEVLTKASLDQAALNRVFIFFWAFKFTSTTHPTCSSAVSSRRILKTRIKLSGDHDEGPQGGVELAHHEGQHQLQPVPRLQVLVCHQFVRRDVRGEVQLAAGCARAPDGRLDEAVHLEGSEPLGNHACAEGFLGAGAIGFCFGSHKFRSCRGYGFFRVWCSKISI